MLLELSHFKLALLEFLICHINNFLQLVGSELRLGLALSSLLSFVCSCLFQTSKLVLQVLILESLVEVLLLSFLESCVFSLEFQVLSLQVFKLLENFR